MGKRKTVSTQKKKLWKIFTKYVRLRDARKATGGTQNAPCISCNRMYPISGMDAGHFISRSYLATCFDEKNVHAQCKQCNMRGGEQFLYAQNIDKLYGEGTADELSKKRYQMVKYSVLDYDSWIEEYKEKYKKLLDK